MTALGIVIIIALVFVVGIGIGIPLGFYLGYDKGKLYEASHWKQKGEWEVKKGERHE